MSYNYTRSVGTEWPQKYTFLFCRRSERHFCCSSMKRITCSAHIKREYLALWQYNQWHYSTLVVGIFVWTYYWTHLVISETLYSIVMLRLPIILCCGRLVVNGCGRGRGDRLKLSSCWSHMCSGCYDKTLNVER